MGQRSGDRSGGRRALGATVAALALALAVAGAGCAGAEDDGGGGGAPTAPPTTAEPSSASTSPTTPTTLPEGEAAVPIDEELVGRLPRLFDVDGIVADDETFDERLCDGRKAPATPQSQARATYALSETETLTIAAYRFAADLGPYYLSVYSEAVRTCAVEAGDSTDLGLAEAVGYSYRLKTTRGDAFTAVALSQDVLWVLFQERTDGQPEVDPSTVASFISAVEA